jgi:GNAT superfamily N-acetyltransferase
MKITVVPTDAAWEEYEKQAWQEADTEHYGQPLDWKSHKYTLIACDDKSDVEIAAPVGWLRMKIELGVCQIDALVVSKMARGQGVGTLLLKKAESVAHQLKAHKMFLQTGKTWDSVRFYQNNGYTISAELPNHFFHVDYVELIKFL